MANDPSLASFRSNALGRLATQVMAESKTDIVRNV